MVKSFPKTRLSEGYGPSKVREKIVLSTFWQCMQNKSYDNQSLVVIPSSLLIYSLTVKESHSTEKFKRYTQSLSVQNYFSSSKKLILGSATELELKNLELKTWCI